MTKVLTFARRLKDNGGKGNAGKENRESRRSATNYSAVSTPIMTNIGHKNTERKVAKKKIRLLKS